MISRLEYCTYKAETTLGYAVNILSQAGVRVFKPKPIEGVVMLSVNGKDAERAQTAMDAHNIIYTRLRTDGAKPKLKNFFTKYAFIVGLVVSVIGVGAYGATIGGVRVEGTETVDKELVEEVCAEYVRTPCLKRQVDMSSLRNAILSIDGVAYVGVAEDGRNIVVEIVEELPKTQITDTQSPIAVIAKEDGTITGLIVYRGTPAVAIGDSVHAGDTLIFPYVGKEDSVRREVRAMGRVTARVKRKQVTEYESESEYEARVARDIEERVRAFKEGLSEGETFLGYYFSTERLDKTIQVSIYYDIITQIT